MLVPSTRLSTFRVLPGRGVKAVAEPKVGVLVNARARGVTPKIIRSLSHVVADGDLHVSRSISDLAQIARTVADRTYHTLFTAGGDGTFRSFVNAILDELATRSKGGRLPRFGVLKLGTGNGLAGMLKASPRRGNRILDDVLRARAAEVPGYRRIDLLTVEGQRAVFAGVGIDGRLINDYLWIKDRFAKGALRPILSGGGGYFSALALRTVPHYLTHSTWTECEIRNGKEGMAFKLDDRGAVSGNPIPPGGLIFRGRINIAAAATIPFYGYDFKAFPFAGQRKGMMQLRLGALTAPGVLANLPKLWRGKWIPSTMVDFHVQSVEIQFARPMPLQIAGDAEGERDRIHLAMAAEQLEMVDFSGAVC